jgi:hypothetical protein
MSENKGACNAGSRQKIADCRPERRPLFQQFRFLKYMDAQRIR